MTDPDPLAGLDDAERLACHVAEWVTGARARAWDVPGVKGRTGVVDAFLDYPTAGLLPLKLPESRATKKHCSWIISSGEQGSSGLSQANGGGSYGFRTFESFPDYSSASTKSSCCAKLPESLVLIN